MTIRLDVAELKFVQNHSMIKAFLVRFLSFVLIPYDEVF